MGIPSIPSIQSPRVTLPAAGHAQCSAGWSARPVPGRNWRSGGVLSQGIPSRPSHSSIDEIHQFIDGIHSFIDGIFQCEFSSIDSHSHFIFFHDLGHEEHPY